MIALVAHFYPRLGHGDWIPRSLQGLAVKGHEDLIRAAPHVLERFPNARFVLVGGGFAGVTDYLDETKALVETLGLRDRVVFPGHRANVNGVLSDATVAVQASLCENLGGTLEALAMGRPIVATRVGGMVDVVEDGVTGLLAEPRNPGTWRRESARSFTNLSGRGRWERAGDNAWSSGSHYAERSTTSMPSTSSRSRTLSPGAGLLPSPFSGTRLDFASPGSHSSRCAHPSRPNLPGSRLTLGEPCWNAGATVPGLPWRLRPSAAWLETSASGRAPGGPRRDPHSRQPAQRGPSFAELWSYRELLLSFCSREMLVRHKQTLLGSGWLVLQPLLHAVGLALFMHRLARVPSDGAPYALFAYTGLLPWLFFSNGVQSLSYGLMMNSHLVSRVYFHGS